MRELARVLRNDGLSVHRNGDRNRQYQCHNNRNELRSDGLDHGENIIDIDA
ncbi:hypothetical protein [Bifidobacterium sp. UBA4282]|uniref:hypothetical protein n=1 Tax=Bifidobacterium sp. UBA4282 TaxID=1946096 RepID=UPI0025C0CAEC|nr:hypothetical protein [Bifidobacterium sp. UBA4282]